MGLKVEFFLLNFLSIQGMILGEANIYLVQHRLGYLGTQKNPPKNVFLQSPLCLEFEDFIIFAIRRFQEI